jgi:biotin/methionine sulfoxide reductase
MVLGAGETVSLPDFDQFWNQGIVMLPRVQGGINYLSAFRADPAANPLPTPSGRIEIFSENIAGFDLPDCVGHPRWYEPSEWLGANRAETFPLHLISDQPERRLHSQLDHAQWSIGGKVAGREPVLINTQDALARGIAPGEIVRVFNDRGACLAGAVVSDRIARGVVKLSTGAWYDPESADKSDSLEKHGNPNVLTLDEGASMLSQGCVAQSCLVEVERFAAVAPAVTAHDPPVIVEKSRR